MKRLIGLGALTLAVGWYGCSASGSGNQAGVGQVAGNAGTATTGGGSQGASGGMGNSPGGGSAGESLGGASMAGNPGSGTAGSTGTGATGATGGDAGVPDVSFDFDAGQPDTALNNETACAETKAEAELAPLDMYVMLDRSGSMSVPQADVADGDCNVGENVDSRWCYAINALDGFFGAPSSSGMGVALQYFPNNGCSQVCLVSLFGVCIAWGKDCSCSGTCCTTGGAHATADVGYGLLPGHATTLVASMNAEVPSGGTTPTESALRGLTSWTGANVQASRSMIGVLLTDGLPNECATASGTLASIVGTHLANTGIKTFVIGMTGADFSVLESIAAAGGADTHTNYCAGSATSCHYYNVGSGSSQPLIEALKDIQSSVVGCTFQMPTSDAGIIDPANVKLEYTPGGGGAVQTIDQVTDAAACSGASGGFYYDNNAAPSRIDLCPSTCSAVQGDPGAQVQVLLGCLGS